MKRSYIRPSAMVTKINVRLMQLTPGSIDTTSVYTEDPVDTGDAMSREESDFSLWDDE